MPSMQQVSRRNFWAGALLAVIVLVLSNPPAPISGSSRSRPEDPDMSPTGATNRMSKLSNTTK
jgi:hypothetical protein